MATRVLNTIKENGRIIGFRLMSSKQGIMVLNLDDAKNYYKTVEHFENVNYVGKGQWEGKECGLHKFPYTDKAGNWKECNEKIFILGKIFSGDTLVGYKLMDLNGEVFYKNVDETFVLGQNVGFINAKIVPPDTISAIRGSFREFPITDKSKEVLNTMGVNIVAMSKDEHDKLHSQNLHDLNVRTTDTKGTVMDAKTREAHYRKLAQMFADKDKGLVNDIDIAGVVGAKTGAEYSRKIHEYLDEPLDVPDKDILVKLYGIYKNMNKAGINDVQQTVQPVKTAVQQPVQQNVSQPVSQSKPVSSGNPDVDKMQELIDILTKAAEVYYSGEDEIMSNYEYDAKYDELQALEKKTGIILAGSLTQKVGFEIKSKLQKVKHENKALSLDKTKDRQDLANSLGGQPGFLSLKLDGLTIVLTYNNGELVSAVTRGDGVTGEDVTHNAKFFKGVPLKIAYQDKLIIRGEALIGYKDFERVNSTITNPADKYKNPRNLASGSVRQLDSKIAKERHVRVVAFTVVEGFDNLKLYTEKLEELRKYGFEIVDYVKVTPATTVAAIGDFEQKVKKLDYPTDGLVITIDDIAYGEMLGMTAKFPRNAKAFKWADDNYDTNMVDVEWSVGRTGAITPVAVFEPVDIDGAMIRRASIHNVSIFKNLKLGKGDIVSIFRANMVIPQVSENKTKSGTFDIPKVCPVCGQPTTITKLNDAEVLMCTNPDCTARHLGSLSHFVSRDCMNIEGLSDATLEVFVNEGFIRTYKDIYHLNEHEREIVNLDGFGKGSYSKLWKAIEKSRECELPAFIGSLGIPQMGKGTSKDVCRALDYDLDKLMNMSADELQAIDGVGGKTAIEIAKYFDANRNMVKDLAAELHFKAMPKVNKNSAIAGMTFCITGDVYKFKNRKELQAKIESLGAKASSSVSAKTNYLINNDITSTSNKNQTAKQLGVPIISELDFLKMIGE